MKKNEIKKVLVNGVIASGICMNMVACTTAQAGENVEPDISETTITSRIDNTTYTTETGKTAEETTVSTETIVDSEITLSMEDIVSISNNYRDYLLTQTNSMVSQSSNTPYGKELKMNEVYAFVYLMNEEYISDEETSRLINTGLISSDITTLSDDATNLCAYIGYYNGSYAYFMNALNKNKDLTVFMSASSATKNDTIKNQCILLDTKYASYVSDNYENDCIDDFKNNKIINCELSENCTPSECLVKIAYDYGYIMYCAQYLDDELTDKLQTQLNDDCAKVSTSISERECFQGNQKTLVK